jgi:hypothetical protein
MPIEKDGAGTLMRHAPAPRKGVPMKMIQALVKKFKPADNLASNAWPYHVI